MRPEAIFSVDTAASSEPVDQLFVTTRAIPPGRFGASAPEDEVLRRLGVTSEAVTTAVREVACRRAQRSP